MRMAGIAITLLIVCSARADYNCNGGVEFHPDGSFRRCVLNGNHRLTLRNGLTLVCANGHDIEDHPEGHVRRCTLAEPLAQCARGSRVELDAQGTLLDCYN